MNNNEFDFDKEFEEFRKRINSELSKGRDNDASNKININSSNDETSIKPTESEDINFSEADYHDYHHMDVLEDDDIGTDLLLNDKTENVEGNFPPADDEILEIENEVGSKGLSPIGQNFDSAETDSEENISLNSPEDQSENAKGADINGESFYQETIINKSKKDKRKSFRRAVAIAVIASLLGGSTAGLTFGVGTTLAKNYLDKQPKEPYTMSQNNSTEKEDSGTKVSATALSSNGTVSQVIKNVQPAVVCITVTIKNDTTAYGGFFSVPDQEAAGSGIIFDEDDEKVYIVTNKHVIDKVTTAGVAIGDSDPVPAALVGKSTDTDLAVISVEKADLAEVGITEVVTAKFGDSDSVTVGDFVVAIGNALGEGNTATFGMISAKDKEIKISDTGETITALQTDAAINHGNSGGALISLNSEVIGINTAKLSELSVEGMGYSITSNEAVPIIEDIMNNPESKKVYLGIRGGDVTEEMMELYNLPSMGVIISSVTEGSGAEKAGLQPYDIITTLDGEAIFNMQSLKDKLTNYSAGDVVSLKILRNGKEQREIKVELISGSSTGF